MSATDNTFPTRMLITGIGCGQIVAAKDYPATDFINAKWSQYHKYDPRSLVHLQSTYREDIEEIKIHAFYAKIADDNAWSCTTEFERHVISGKGSLLMYSCLEGAPDHTKVKLDASGGFPWNMGLHKKRAKELSTESIVSYFLERQSLGEDVSSLHERSRDTLEESMTALLQTDELAEYYQTRFGFVKRGYDGVWSVRMITTVGTIRRRAREKFLKVGTGWPNITYKTSK